MGRSELLQGIREMKFISVRSRVRGGELTQLQAAELLGISDRTLRRWSERYAEEGPAGLTDRRRGNAALNRASEAEADSVELLYRRQYAGFTARHFHEHLVRLCRDYRAKVSLRVAAPYEVEPGGTPDRALR